MVSKAAHHTRQWTDLVAFNRVPTEVKEHLLQDNGGPYGGLEHCQHLFRVLPSQQFLRESSEGRNVGWLGAKEEW